MATLEKRNPRAAERDGYRRATMMEAGLITPLTAADAAGIPA